MKHLLIWWLWMALCIPNVSHAQSAPPPSLEGRWTGALGEAPNRLRLVLDIQRAADSLTLGTLTSVDQGNVVLPVDAIEQSGGTVSLTVKIVNGSFEGTLSADGSKLAGRWSQGGPIQPLEFVREIVSAGAAASTPAAVPSGPVQAALSVPIAPMPVPGGGKTRLIYELHIVNGGPPFQLARLDILSGGATLASYEGLELNGLLQQPGRQANLDKRALGSGAGAGAIAFLSLDLDPGRPVPATLRHRLTAMAGETIDGAVISIPATKPMVLGAPLSGDNWMAGGGPGSTVGHRKAMMQFDGKTYIAQRFAIDWVRLNETGVTFKGDPRDNKSYRAYGAEALAVADGIVVAIKDGIPENIPGPTSRAVPINMDTIGGNHVVLDLGQGRFAFYAHLQPGGLKVKVGDRVRAGQLVGLVGNSGNSTEPHLHFHLTNGTGPLAAEGIPYVLDAFEVQDWPGGAWRKVRGEIPMDMARVRFAGAGDPPEQKRGH